MRKIKDNKPPITWLTTYSDLVTLLMVFFIFLISFGEVKKVKTQIILSAFSGKLGVKSGGEALVSTAEFQTLGQSFETLPSAKPENSLERSTNSYTAIFNPFVQSRRVRVVENERGTVISLFSDVFFEADSAKFDRENAREILENIRLLIDSPDFKGKVLIEGHSDNIPYQGTEFRDSWDLSLERAWVVFSELSALSSIYPFDESRVSLHGYGPTLPIEDNRSPEGRAYNRRVDIVLEAGR